MHDSEKDPEVDEAGGWGAGQLGMRTDLDLEPSQLRMQRHGACLELSASLRLQAV